MRGGGLRIGGGGVRGGEGLGVEGGCGEGSEGGGFGGVSEPHSARITTLSQALSFPLPVQVGPSSVAISMRKWARWAVSECGREPSVFTRKVAEVSCTRFRRSSTVFEGVLWALCAAMAVASVTAAPLRASRSAFQNVCTLKAVRVGRLSVTRSYSSIDHICSENWT